MATATQAAATLADLMRVRGKAELIGGRVVEIMPTGYWPSKVAWRIALSLHAWVAAGGVGEVIADNAGYAFATPLPSGRQSFSPDASLYTGPVSPKQMQFIDGCPAFAVEVRSASDTGPKMDAEYAAKRKDYFYAGTLVVWDVDPVNETVTKYAATDPLTPVAFHAGDTADAEPAAPGWRLSVDALFAASN
jgi:Uma2 family endonuclease